VGADAARWARAVPSPPGLVAALVYVACPTALRHDEIALDLGHGQPCLGEVAPALVLDGFAGHGVTTTEVACIFVRVCLSAALSTVFGSPDSDQSQAVQVAAAFTGWPPRVSQKSTTGRGLVVPLPAGLGYPSRPVPTRPG
jgi:hypothetical protein